ncbi:hypothetical protein ARMGADRAFT_1077556 [Armillaria gallica]|uniref:Uncharacterized protein n=1 Tax=Armillaria gallica TaxID=47427 RepID=A0A2H3DPN1_ARMGA|nr:hypothetical protein ARMGADRAFT_1077556 [Armillaria gallica]
MSFKIPVLLYASLFTYIFLVLSLDITIPTQFHPRVNDTASVLLNWSSEDPSHFYVALRRSTPPDMNFTTSIQPVESFIETRDVSVVFRYTGTTFIEAFTTSTTEADSIVTLASSVFFQVDEALTTGSDPFSAVSVGGDLFSSSFNQDPFLSLGVCYFSLCGFFNHLSSLGVRYGDLCTGPFHSHYNKRLITIET